jgi:hypothetical protein
MNRLLTITVLAAAALALGVLATDVLSVSQAKSVPPIELKQTPHAERPGAATQPQQQDSVSKPTGPKQPPTRPPASPSAGAAPAPVPAPVRAGEYDGGDDDNDDND